MPTFSKQERLCSQRDIQLIFKQGKSIKAYPFFLNYRLIDTPDSGKIKVVIMVSKRKYKLATDRNRIKRIIRELYRKHKSVIYEGFVVPQGKELHIGISYIASSLLPEMKRESSFSWSIKAVTNELQKTIS